MRETWDALATGDTATYVGDPARGREELDALFGRLGADPHGGFAVEVGCGPGRMTEGLAERFDRVLGLDVSPVMVSRAREAVPLPSVEFRATRGTATPPFTERWDLAYPDAATASQTVTLQLGPLAGKAAPARLTAAPGGDPKALLERVAVVLGGGTPAIEPLPTSAVDLRLDLLGERLSVGQADEGATVIAGAFVMQPAGNWRVFRVSFGTAADAPQCFLGMSEAARAAVLLPREVADGPAIDTQLRALLSRAPRES